MRLNSITHEEPYLVWFVCVGTQSGTAWSSSVHVVRYMINFSS